MEFALSLDQKMLQDSLAGALSRLSPLEALRAHAGGDSSVAERIWSGLVEQGVSGILVDEAHGGLDLTLLDAALAGEVIARFVAPSPFLGTAVLAPIALRAAGTAAQQDRWLPRIAAGEARIGAAIGEAIAGARDHAGVDSNGGRLSGKALFVIDFAAADAFLVADTAHNLHLVEVDAPGLTKIPLSSIDATRSLGELEFSDTPAEAFAAPHEAVLDRLRDAAFVVLAADMLGASQTMLEKAVAYAQERRQFGRVIGSFQAVKHLCAEMAAELEPSRSLVWYAAHAFDSDLADGALTAAHAKAHLAEISRFVARTATEVHGGIGFTDLLGLHHWFKRVGLDRQLLGSPERVRRHAAALQELG